MGPASNLDRQNRFSGPFPSIGTVGGAKGDRDRRGIVDQLPRKPPQNGCAGSDAGPPPRGDHGAKHWRALIRATPMGSRSEILASADLRDAERSRLMGCRCNLPVALERDWRCYHVVKPRAVRENERSCSSSGSPARPTLLSSQIAFYGRCRSILSTSVTKANVDPAEKAHERRNEKTAQIAPAITSPVFTGPQMTFPLIYCEITTDLEEPCSFGFLSWSEMTLRRILRLFVLAPAKSQAGIKANSVKGGAMRELRRILSRIDW